MRGGEVRRRRRRTRRSASFGPTYGGLRGRETTPCALPPHCPHPSPVINSQVGLTVVLLQTTFRGATVRAAPRLHPPLIMLPSVGGSCLWEVLGLQPRAIVVWLPTSPVMCCEAHLQCDVLQPTWLTLVPQVP